ncbi:hypothetical protein [Consotaella aegiceratis]|uniref:hypothetical protein n=1 Tax=Consotaella aegiceratis TaxID=3097961 RepID=UPI002F41581A
MNDIGRSLSMGGLKHLMVLPVAALLTLAGPPVSAEAAACTQMDAIATLAAKQDQAGAAILVDADCAKAMAATGKRENAVILLDAGYPSVLVGQFESNDLMLALEQQVDQGDHGFFSTDRSLGSVLQIFADENPDLADQALRVRDFALASQAATTGQDTSAEPSDRKRYAMFLPVWQSNKTRENFLRICSEADCGTPPATFNACDVEEMEANKLAYANDPASFMAKAEKCDTSLQNLVFVQALRKFGMIDSSCSPTMQINAVVKTGLEAAASCTGLLKAISEQSAFSSADVVRYYRRVQDSEFTLPPDVALRNADDIAFISPSIAERLRSFAHD